MADTRTRNSGSNDANVQTPKVYDTPDDGPRSQSPREPVREPIRNEPVTPPGTPEGAPAVYTTSSGEASSGGGPAVYPAPATTTTRVERRYSEPTLGDLFKGLSNDLTTLVRKEIELAKTEVQENAKKAMRGGIMIGIGGLLAYAGLILLLIAISIALGNALLNYWLSTGIVALIVLIIAAILYSTGKSQLDEVELTPRKTVETLEDDVEMAKEKFS
jgi:uncharacterized membrane protein YqjE